jgi:hypothetical protein
MTSATPPTSKPGYLDWRKFHANGVNLGSWFCLETFMVPEFFNEHGKCAPDEWTVCKNLGPEAAGRALEAHYQSFFTNEHVDILAAQNINVLRIPFTYAAWIDVPGSPHYRGSQVETMRRLATYAIEKYGMHIVIDLHALPGGVNWLEIGEAHGHGGWFYSKENLELSYKAVDAVLEYIQHASGHAESYTLAPFNEAVDNKDIRTFGTPLALSDEAAAWLLKYVLGVVHRVEAVNPHIPIMVQDSFKGEAFWASRLPAAANIVIDVHVYYFAGRRCDPDSVLLTMPKDARDAQGTGTFPVVIGEWSIEAEIGNRLDRRKALFEATRKEFNTHTQGNIYWSGKVDSDAKVDGEGTKRDYWSFLDMVRDGVVTPF